MSIQHTDSSPTDLSRLRIDRDAPPRRRWLPFAVMAACGAAGATEVSYKFGITPGLLAAGLVFSAVIGAAGGLLPSLRAARIPIARALRDI